MYLIAIIFPPLAVLMAGRPFQAIINVLLTCLWWIPGMIHAFFVVSEFKSEERALKYNPQYQEDLKKKEEEKIKKWKKEKEKYYPDKYYKNFKSTPNPYDPS